LGASCKNARSTEKENYTQVINSSAQETPYMCIHLAKDETDEEWERSHEEKAFPSNDPA
jgi:hypothetical protein